MELPEPPPGSAQKGPAGSGLSLSRRGFLTAIAATTGAATLAACSPSPNVAPSASPSGSTAATGALDVRRVAPPKLDKAQLGKRTLCYRPLRKGSPNLSVEIEGSTIIAHNYGHGGSGWTLAPGSAQYVVDLLEASPEGTGLPKDTPITVVGAGTIGLFTAYELVQRGYTNITIKAESFDNLTSHNAAGLLAPVSMDNDPELQKVIDKIGIDAYKFFASVADGTQKDFKEGAVIVPTYFENREESGLEPYVGQVMQPAKDVVLDFGNGTTRPMVAYDDGIFIDTAGFMKELTDYLKPKVRIEKGKVTDLTALGSKVVFDCTGLGAAELDDDANMVSVQGHLIMLKDQAPADLKYMILVYFDEAKTQSGQKVKRSFYFMPKRLLDSGPNDVGVVGGTFIEGATPETPNYEEFDVMMAGARNFYGI